MAPKTEPDNTLRATRRITRPNCVNFGNGFELSEILRENSLFHETGIIFGYGKHAVAVSGTLKFDITAGRPIVIDADT